LSPAGRRRCIDHVKDRLGISERRACRTLGQHRSTQRQHPPGPSDEASLTADIIELARTYGRYGYRRVTALLTQAGWHVNHKRVERIWRREGLKVPQKQAKKGRLWLNDGSCIRLRPERPNHVWSYDFVHDRTDDGRVYRTLNIIDEFTREALAIRVDRKLNSIDVVDALTDLFILRGPPAFIRSDNGPEFIAEKVRGWISAVGAKTAYITPAARQRFVFKPREGARPGKTDIAKASTPASVMSCSTAKSSTHSRRQRSSSNNGESTITASDLTVLWAGGRQPLR